MAFSSRIHERKKLYKSTIDGAETRRRREDEAVQIRKQEKEEQLSRRRRLAEVSSDLPVQNAHIADIPRFAESLMSVDPLSVAEAVVAIRQILSVDRNPPVAEVLATGVLPRLRDLLTDSTRPTIQLEACWALTNIASGTAEQTEAVVNSGAVPLFVKLLASPDVSLQEQAIWAIANIAGDRVAFRDGCIEVGTVASLSTIVDYSLTKRSVQMTRLGVWGLSNMCRGKPSPSFASIQPALPVLGRCLVSSNDSEILADTAWALSYITDNASPEATNEVLLHINLTRLVALLGHPSSAVHTPILRTVGNLVSGQSETTRRVVGAGVVQQLKSLMHSVKKSVRRECMWAISNICADSQSMLQAVIDNGLMDKVLHVLAEGTTDSEIRKEAAWAVCNACTVGNRSQIRYLVSGSQVSAIETLAAYMETCKDTRSVVTVLDAIFAILAHDESYSQLLEECGGLTLIEDLQQDESEQVYEKSVKILESYFTCDDVLTEKGEANASAPKSQAFARSG